MRSASQAVQYPNDANPEDGGVEGGGKEDRGRKQTESDFFASVHPSSAVLARAKLRCNVLVETLERARPRARSLYE